MNRTDRNILIIAIVFLAFVTGVVVGERVARRDYQDGTVEHGYAEWVPAENPRAKPVFQWIEPEVAHELQ